MNKQELVRAVADSIEGGTQKTAEKYLNTILEVIGEELADGGDVILVGFGTFATKRREERSGRNPRTGEAIVIPAATVPVFTPGKKLKDAVSG
jgi:nucleoid DNA-binding protein